MYGFLCGTITEHYFQSYLLQVCRQTPKQKIHKVEWKGKKKLLNSCYSSSRFRIFKPTKSLVPPPPPSNADFPPPKQPFHIISAHKYCCYESLSNTFSLCFHQNLNFLKVCEVNDELWALKFVSPDKESTQNLLKHVYFLKVFAKATLNI